MRFLAILFLVSSCGNFDDDRMDRLCVGYADREKAQMRHDLEIIRREYDERAGLCENMFEARRLLYEDLNSLTQKQLEKQKGEIDRLTQENVDLKLKMRKLNERVKR